MSYDIRICITSDGHLTAAHCLLLSRAALDNVGAHADKNSFRYADALSVRADALLATGHRQDAQGDLRVVVDTLKRTVGPKHPLTIAASGKLALLQLRTAARVRLQGLVGRD